MENSIQKISPSMSVRIRILTLLLFLMGLSSSLAEDSTAEVVHDHPWVLIFFVLGVIIFASLAVFLWNVYLQGKMNKVVKDLKDKNRQLILSQEEIQRRENKFRLIFQNAPYAIVISRLDNGQIVDANKIFVSRRGLQDGNLGNIRSSNLVPEPDEEKMARLERLKENQAIHNEQTTVRYIDGSLGHIIYSSVPLDVNGEPHVLTMTLDITEQVKTREALQKSENKFRNMFNSAPIGIFRTTYDGKIVEVNATLAKMLGYDSGKDMISQIKSIAEEVYLHPEERQRNLDSLFKLPKGGQVETVLKRADGQLVYAIIKAASSFDEEGNPTWVDGTVEDITSLKQAEMETRRLVAAVEQTNDIIVITDPEGVIQYTNPAFEQVTGYTKQEALGRKPNILKSGRHDESFYNNLWDTINQGKTWSGNIINKRKDGSLFTEEATISPMFDKNGNIVNFVASKRDITDELALKEQNRQMQKMEAIGRLTGGVAHDFNNLLQAMNGFVELASMDLPHDHRSRAFLEQTLSAGSRAANLVQQLLIFSRRQTMKTKTLDLNSAVGDLLKMVGRIIGEHIRVYWNPWDAPLFVHADSGMLDQILMNLCVNARDAMPKGGILHISTSLTEIDSAFCANHIWAKPGVYALLSVKDTGSGMDAETMEHIFEPFFTTKDEGKGTGLGLATVYGIVKQHGGMIDVASEPGQGAEFKIFLPQLKRGQWVERNGQEEMVSGGNETILIAEDDSMVREMASAFLKRGGYKVLAARDGQEAVDLFRYHFERINLVILDVVMPNLGGRGAYEQIREIKPEVPVIICSAYNEEGENTEFVIREGLSFVQKPYSSNMLLKSVRRILDHGPWSGIFPEN